MPFRCPLFQVLNYPVTFCWKSSTRDVTSVDQTHGVRHLPTRNEIHVPSDLSAGFLSALLAFCFAPRLLLPTCNIPHWRCTRKESRHQHSFCIRHRRATGVEKGTVEAEELCLELAVPRWIPANPSPGNRGYCCCCGAVPLKLFGTQKAWL